MTIEIAPYRFTTRNLRAGENAAHSRAGAQARGFRGSIVGGAIVYGQMIRPLIDRLGAAWLERSVVDVKFTAPAYDDDAVEARFEPLATESRNLRARSSERLSTTSSL